MPALCRSDAACSLDFLKENKYPERIKFAQIEVFFWR